MHHRRRPPPLLRAFHASVMDIGSQALRDERDRVKRFSKMVLATNQAIGGATGCATCRGISGAHFLGRVP